MIFLYRIYQGFLPKAIIKKRKPLIILLIGLSDRAMDMEIQQVPWWNRRSRLERRFFVLAISLLCVAVGLAIGLTGVLYKNMNRKLGLDSIYVINLAKICFRMF